MTDLPWRICQYFYSGECPYQSSLSKAILIPQLLDPNEIERIRKLCEACEKCRDEKRTSLRINKPLKVAIIASKPTKGIQGAVVDISSTGALIDLEDWADFRVGQTLEIKIFSDEQDNHEDITVDNQSCVIRRLEKKSHRLAVMFTKK